MPVLSTTNGVIVARVNVRCSKEKCKRRFVFTKHPDDYLRPRRCVCGGTKFRVDKDRMNRNSAKESCTCMGYNWGGYGHRIGSGACWYNTDGAMREITEEEYGTA